MWLRSKWDATPSFTLLLSQPFSTWTCCTLSHKPRPILSKLHTDTHTHTHTHPGILSLSCIHTPMLSHAHKNPKWCSLSIFLVLFPSSSIQLICILTFDVISFTPLHAHTLTISHACTQSLSHTHACTHSLSHTRAHTLAISYTRIQRLDFPPIFLVKNKSNTNYLFYLGATFFVCGRIFPCANFHLKISFIKTCIAE